MENVCFFIITNSVEISVVCYLSRECFDDEIVYFAAGFSLDRRYSLFDRSSVPHCLPTAVLYRLHGRVVKGVGHLDEAMGPGCRDFSLHGWTLAMMKLWRREVVGSIPDEFLVQPGNWYGFLICICLPFKILNLFGILSPWGNSNYRPSAPFLHEVASHVKNCHFGDYYYYYERVAWLRLCLQVTWTT